MKKLKASIKNREFTGVYLFYGEEEYLKTRYETELINALVPEEARMMNLDIFEEKRISADGIIEVLKAPPFLSESRVVIVRDSGFFKSGKKEDSERIAGFLSELPPEAHLIFNEKEVDKRARAFKAAEKAGRAVEFKTPGEKDLMKWVALELSKSKVKIAPETAAYFLRSIGGDMETAVREMEKLAAFKGEGGAVLEGDIDAVCVKALETRIFDLVGTMGRGELKKALTIYRNLIMTKEPPMRVLAMVTRQIRLIYQCKTLSREGVSLSEAAARLGQREFVVRECMRQAGSFSEETLRRALEDCLDADMSIKTGRMKDELAVELLIVKYSGNTC